MTSPAALAITDEEIARAAALVRATPILPAETLLAERFVRETYDNDPAVSRRWLATHRANLVRYAADAFRLKATNEQAGATGKRARITA